MSSHYFHARLPDQFDAILHFDETRAVEPLERAAIWEHGEVQETILRRFKRWALAFAVRAAGSRNIDGARLGIRNGADPAVWKPAQKE